MKHDDTFSIYVEQLRKGDQKVSQTLPPDFLAVADEDLKFNDPVSVDGSAYLASEELILHLKIKTYGELPCSICNEPVKCLIDLPDFYHAEPVKNIKGGVFDYRELLREAILLEVPLVAECDGNCEQRPYIQKYLKEEGSDDERYHPFADL